VLIGSNHNESTLFGKFITPFGLGAKDEAGAINLENDFRCGTAEGAKARAMNNVPVWRYLFANNKPGSIQGATHGDDVAYIFGDGRPGLSKLFQDTWGAFVENPAEGLAKIGWPTYDPKGMS
jgi:cholinesterase